MGAGRPWGTGGHLEHPLVHDRFARRLSLAAELRVPVEADGEFIGRMPIEVRLCPEALVLAAPGPAVENAEKDEAVEYFFHLARLCFDTLNK